MRNLLKSNKNTKDIQLPNKAVEELLINSYYQKLMQNADNIDVNINHLENIFTNETYYLAMKIVPLLERKVLYLAYIENLRLNDICKRLKLPKQKIISIRSNAINHFKNNLNTVSKINNIKNGGDN